MPAPTPATTTHNITIAISRSNSTSTSTSRGTSTNSNSSSSTSSPDSLGAPNTSKTPGAPFQRIHQGQPEATDATMPPLPGAAVRVGSLHV